jgi:hypothetical protein
VHFYRVSGLAVASEIVLPGLIPLELPAAEPDVRISRSQVPDAIADAIASGPSWQLGESQLLVRVDGIVRMLMTGGREIRFEVDATGEAAENVAIFLMGTGWGLLLQQRGRIVLHASAVRVGNSAVLFCGASGTGKSTLAASLDRAGYAFVSDDVCALTLAPGGTPRIEPDGRQLKLWQNAIEQLVLDGYRGAPVRSALEKYYVEPERSCAVALPVAALYFLREARGLMVPGISRLNIVDAARMVRGHAYRPTMVGRMKQEDLYFAAAGELAGHAGVFALNRDLNFAEMPMVLGWLDAHWRELGLIESPE